MTSIVNIHVVRAKKLAACEAQLMAVVMLDNKQACKTKPVAPTADGDAVWDEAFAFDCSNYEKGEVNVAIWSADGETFLGQVVVPVPYIPKEEQKEPKSVRLEKRKWRLADKVQGELELKMSYKGSSGKKVTVDDFAPLKVLGRGGFGKVVQVRKKDTGRIYAMKAIRKEHVLARNEIEHTLAERNVLTEINHPFIVNLKYSFQTDDRLYLVMDYMNGGELFFHLQREEKFAEDRARFYAAEICMAMEYLHNKDIVYRDLKPENILLDAYGHVAITDFGLCKQNLGINESTSTFCGSLAYMAPEVLDPDEKTGGYTRTVDWWSFGVLLYEMLAGLPPFYSNDQMEMAQLIRSKPLEFTPEFSAPAQEILRKLLDRNPRQRLANGTEIKTQSFFSAIDWDALYARRVATPFIPIVKSETDVQYFDAEFTDEAVMESVIESTLSASVQANFQGFSYANPSEMKK